MKLTYSSRVFIVGQGHRLGKELFDSRELRLNRPVYALDGCADVGGCYVSPKDNVLYQCNFLRAEVCSGGTYHVLHRRVGFGQFNELLLRFGIDALAHQQAFAFAGQHNGYRHQ